MRVIVCGGRNFYDRDALDVALSAFNRKHPLTLVITGGARGADTLAETWAHQHGIHTCRIPALWDTHGKAAGGIRNSVMLTVDPEAVIAFPGGSGTADMVQRAMDEGLPIWKPYAKDGTHE